MGIINRGEPGVAAFPSVYLCGPIHTCTDQEAKEWRGMAVDQLVNMRTVDPMVRDYRGREASRIREIVEQDKQDIDGVDVLLVNYAKPSAGTSMEILYAWERGKLVVVVATEPISPWVQYHASTVLSTFGEAFAYIRAMYGY